MAPRKPIRTGTYVLLVSLEHRRHIQVGRLGRFVFEAGTYAYVGSAMNGLDARVARHKRREKKLRWHIDYLLQHGKVIDILDFESIERQECQINELVQRNWNTRLPVPRFGSSDCRCTSHLHLLPPGADRDALRL